MFRAIAALALATTSAQTMGAQSPAALNPANSWWERVTVTVSDDGTTHSCMYQTSREAAGQDCSTEGGANAKMLGASVSGGQQSAKDQYSRITFERRFTPGVTPQTQTLEPGETLLGGQVMALAIDARGAVKHCKIVATSGAVTPQYGCDEAAAEKFEASVGGAKSSAGSRDGYMTILVYGHSEHLV
ncbi:hypothetical protein [Sphingomonas flavescens]|uniref:hypothetical protein n=1 Tax=Sphingomonas flavescens TaxID=3132797 RepID=UPI0028050060|nr:hypothetical protein [Sphingomonas limnosediminicola]